MGDRPVSVSWIPGGPTARNSRPVPWTPARWRKCGSYTGPNHRQSTSAWRYSSERWPEISAGSAGRCGQGCAAPRFGFVCSSSAGWCCLMPQQARQHGAYGTIPERMAVAVEGLHSCLKRLRSPSLRRQNHGSKLFLPLSVNGTPAWRLPGIGGAGNLPCEPGRALWPGLSLVFGQQLKTRFELPKSWSAKCREEGRMDLEFYQAHYSNVAQEIELSPMKVRLTT